ncbi:m7GpppN-mRNA hydrolase-like [Homarus americanus]|uniref:mRNA-decapping enzyme 2 n=1 Tax=Homarus americanus TaxID=6706 RepID=A0A8J5MM56_HOMAM|nr:m7GpppN-mRNA hydrolase-like [Homarus americanus]
MLQGFRDFKHRVPTYGGLLLNQDLSQVLLVQGFWHRASWGFPKGKINVDEEPYKCAIREVLEETGYDISPLIDPVVYLETSIGEQFVRLYIIPGVSTATEFVPRTKGEIKQLKWFPINQLPSHKNDRNFNKLNGSTNMFYMVMPFVKPLREWLASRHRATVNGTSNNGGREGRRRHRSSTNNSADHHQSYNQTRHSHSPATTSDTNKRPHPSLEVIRKQQNTAFTSYIEEEATGLARLRVTTDSSPRMKETSSKSRSRKSLFSEHQEENQKFTFKNRGKGRNKANRESQPANSGNTTTTLETKPHYHSYSWHNFRINKKEVLEAVETVWSEVTLAC